MTNPTRVLFLLFVLTSIHFYGFEAKEEPIDSVQYYIRNAYSQKNQTYYGRAINFANKALEYSETYNSSRDDANAYLALSEIYYEMGNYTQSKEFLDVADDLSRKVRNEKSTAFIRIARAKALVDEGDYEEGAKLLETTKIYMKRNKLTAYLGNLYYVEGMMYFDQGNYFLAIKTLNRVSPLLNENEKEYILGFTYKMLADAYLATNNIDLAKSNVALAMENGKNHNFIDIETAALKTEADIYKAEGNYKEAYNSLRKFQGRYHLTFDENIILENKQVAENTQLAFKNKIIAELNSKNQEDIETVKKSKMAAILSSALLIIISLLTITLYRNNQIKLKTNDLLIRKNEELTKAKRSAEHAMQAKNEFLNTISHELRTPLYAVTGLTHLLLQENPSKNQKEHLEALKFSGDYLVNLINDILQLNKMEAKKLTVTHELFDLEETITEVLNSLSETAKSNNNTIEVDIDKNIPKELKGDQIKLSQIFINIVGNALKFTENGIIKFTAKKVYPLQAGKSIIIFKVEDNGIGIPDEIQQNIFKSFTQGSVQINRKYGGTGLGLNIVKNLVELLGGTITLKSKINQGTTITFTIPFEKAQTNATPIIESTVPVAASEPENTNIFKNLHLLLVEDNKINQVITKKMLAQKNITCDIADDGYKAIELAKENTYSLILMDIHMPGISGLKATQEIRNFDTKTPIIALTAITLDENTDKFFQVGCDDIVSKPFKPEEFYNAIAKNISKSNTIEEV